MTDTPKIWRDMTPEEKGALLLARYEGKDIEEFSVLFPDEWDAFNILWISHHAYRIKPEPKRETVTIVGGLYHNGLYLFDQQGDSETWHTHRTTFDTIDGKPDPASIKMEEL